MRHLATRHDVLSLWYSHALICWRWYPTNSAQGLPKHSFWGWCISRNEAPSVLSTSEWRSRITGSRKHIVEGYKDVRIFTLEGTFQLQGLLEPIYQLLFFAPRSSILPNTKIIANPSKWSVSILSSLPSPQSSSLQEATRKVVLDEQIPLPTLLLISMPSATMTVVTSSVPRSISTTLLAISTANWL